MEENKNIEINEKLKEVNKKLEDKIERLNEKPQNRIDKLNEKIEKTIKKHEINIEKIKKLQKENEDRLLEIERKINEIKSESITISQRLDNIFPFIIRLSDSRNNEEILNKLEEVEFNDQFINKEEIRCIICLGNFSIGDKISYLPCIHFFHSSCIKNWIRRKNKCPICNNVINFS